MGVIKEGFLEGGASELGPWLSSSSGEEDESCRAYQAVGMEDNVLSQRVVTASCAPEQRSPAIIEGCSRQVVARRVGRLRGSEWSWGGGTG